jgi:hypothetical protein
VIVLEHRPIDWKMATPGPTVMALRGSAVRSASFLRAATVIVSMPVGFKPRRSETRIGRLDGGTFQPERSANVRIG